ncbi:MAG: winged helix-turn-helix transcriptional regulator [Chitinophagaceae bacterium]|nr:winged helix-turn-helix transcriptional regulator [Chitinophagaceae bacterium]
MAKKKYLIGNKYQPRELMELALQLMYDSIPEHTDRADPKVGAVLAKEDGTLVNTAFRGELRQGDHAEFTVLERKHRTDSLDGYVIYATLEPCAPGARSITKLGCAERIVNARIKKAYVGIEDPDPKVKGNGIAYLLDNKIEIDFFDKDLQEEILEANTQFLSEAAERAKLAEQEEIEPAFTELDKSLDNYDLKDFSTDALEKFREKLQLSFPVDSNDFRSVLHKWNFLRIDKKANAVHPTGLGILLFGKNPQIKYPQSLVKFTVKTQNEGKPKILDFDGPLVLMPEKIESYLEINFPKVIDRSSFTRKETKEIYFEVLREVIINAIVHRDYSIEQANINVRIDNDKILVESPGKPLVAMEKLKNFTAPTFSVNPKIANVFYQMKFIEKRNIGMEELHEFSEMMGVNKPSIEFNEPYLQVTLWKKAETKLEPTRTEILDFVRAKGRVSSGDYAEKFGGSTKTASRHLNDLVDEGVLQRDGEKKGTRYFLSI